MKIVKQIQFLLYVITCCILFVIGLLFYKNAMNINNHFETYLKYNVLNQYIFIIVIIFIVLLTVLMLLKNKKNIAMKQYLEENVLPNIHISNTSKNNALRLFKKCVCLKTAYLYTIIIIVFAIVVYYINNITTLTLDISTFTWVSNQTLFDDLLYLLSLFIIITLYKLPLLLFYNKIIIPMFYSDTECYIYLYYLYSSLTHNKMNKLNNTYLFNIGSSLMNIVNYQCSYDTMQFLYHLLKIEKKKNLLFLYHYNCYISLKKLNNELNLQHKQALLKQLENKKIKKSKIGKFVLTRIHLEELYDNQQYNELINYITNHQKELMQTYDLPYNQYLLYKAYKETDNIKYQDIYNKYKDNYIFTKLLEIN